jgi:hypothetical protein
MSDASSTNENSSRSARHAAPLMDPPLRHYARAFALILSLALTLLAIVVGLAYLRFGSLSLARAYLRGERFFVEPRHIELGDGQPGKQREIEICIANYDGIPIRLIGSSASCACMVSETLPLTIPAGSQCTYRLVFTFPPKGSEFRHELLTYTDNRTVNCFVVEIHGCVCDGAVK